MKKTGKILVLISAIAMVALFLCSCRSQNEAKDNQAFYTDSSKTAIILRGNIYRELKLGNLSLINAGNYGSRGSGCYVTEKDVPALLSSWYGDLYAISQDESVIHVYGVCYVREDQYETVKKAVDSAVLDHYYISYYPDTYYSASYDSMKVDYYDTDTVSTILLDQDVTDAINQALMTADNDKVQLTEDTLQSADALIIERCDKNMIVTTYDHHVVLLRDGEQYYVVDDSFYTRNSVCPVEKDGSALIKALFEKYPKAVDQTAF